MKKHILLYALFFVPAFMQGQICTPPDIHQAVIVFTRTSEEPTIDGTYSLAETKKVKFVGGNLLHQPATGRWRIAPRQYDIVGGENKDKNNPPVGVFGTIWDSIYNSKTKKKEWTRCTNDGTHNRNYEGWIDLFSWGTSGWYGTEGDEDKHKPCKWRMDNNPLHKVTANPYDTPNKDSANYILGTHWSQGMTGDYENADWGIFNNIELGGDADHKFRTPTREEAIYLLRTRTNALSLRGMAHIRLICEADRSKDTIVNGLVILPDDWRWDTLALEGLLEKTFKTSADGYVYYEDNEFTAEQWTVMEKLGAIFMPAAGGMSGGQAIKENRSGFYWSATPSGSNKCYNFQFGGMTNKYAQMEEKSEDRFWCRAVRLCQEITEEEPGGGAKGEEPVITGDSYTQTIFNGLGGTITAVQNGANHCLWTLTAHPAAGYQLAYWIDLYGGKSHENPLEIAINTEHPNIVWRAEFVRSNAYIHEWTGDSLYFRSDTTNIFSYSGGGYLGICIEGMHELDASEHLDSVAPGVWGRATSASKDQNAYAGKHMHFVMYDVCHRPTAVIDTIVPVMVYRDTLASLMDFHADTANTSVQVFNGGILTIDENTTFSGILDIHAGGKVVVNEGATLTTKGIIMRGDGINKRWAQLIVNGRIINDNSNIIYYDYTINQREYYPLSLPFDVNCSEVINPITHRAPSYQSYVYDTEERAAGRYGWIEFNDAADGAKFIAGKGYSVYAVPPKWNGKRQGTAIMQFPMVADFSSTCETEKSVAITCVAGEVEPRHKNWNLIGNPYLSNFATTGVSDTAAKIIPGYYEWNSELGAYEWIDGEGTGIRYITYSDDGNRSFQQERLKGFVLKPFNCYFVQTKEGTSLAFSLASRGATPASVPCRAPANDNVKELETGITLTQGNNTEHVGLIFGDYTDDYELNADLAKEFGDQQPMSAYSLMGNSPMAYQALSIESASRPILIGYRKAAQTPMVFSFDDSNYDRSLLDALWLTDMITGDVTNLLVEDYTFLPDVAQDDSRFYLSAQLQRNTPSITTALDETNLQAATVRIYDMFGREILSSADQLPQGVYVFVDSNGQSRKEVIR